MRRVKWDVKEITRRSFISLICRPTLIIEQATLGCMHVLHGQRECILQYIIHIYLDAVCGASEWVQSAVFISNRCCVVAWHRARRSFLFLFLHFSSTLQIYLYLVHVCFVRCTACTKKGVKSRCVDRNRPQNTWNISNQTVNSKYEFRCWCWWRWCCCCCWLSSSCRCCFVILIPFTETYRRLSKSTQRYDSFFPVSHFLRLYNVFCGGACTKTEKH